MGEPQLGFWRGPDGAEYILRNSDDYLLTSYTAMWARILQRTIGINRVIEVGANIGTNLDALSWLRPGINAVACEPNAVACDQLRRKGYKVIEKPVEQINTTMHDLDPADLVFTRGVLIHIPPEDLIPVMMKMAALTDRYIVLAEYYSPQLREIPYRGRDKMLWANDFAGMMMQVDSTLELIDYGFVYRRDPNFPQDDVTWFLLERRVPKP